MLTLFSTLLGFLSSGLPKVFEYVQDRGDKKHELALMAMQRERELALAKEGFQAQAHIEEIRTDQVAMQTQAQERVSMYNHDVKIGEGASQWIINLRASVRPVVTYIFVGLLVVVDMAAIWYGYSTGVAFSEAMDQAFDSEQMAILAAIIAFHFGGRAFSKL